MEERPGGLSSPASRCLPQAQEGRGLEACECACFARVRPGAGWAEGAATGLSVQGVGWGGRGRGGRAEAFLEGRVSCTAMPVEIAPDWFQQLLLCCLDSGTFHSLGEEKARGSEGHSSLPEMLHGIHVPGTLQGGQPRDWVEGSGPPGKGSLSLSGLWMDPWAPHSADLCPIIVPR